MPTNTISFISGYTDIILKVIIVGAVLRCVMILLSALTNDNDPSKTISAIKNVLFVTVIAFFILAIISFARGYF